MKKFLIFILFIGTCYFSVPQINKHIIKYDWLIIPKNILRKKNPFVKSISDLEVIHTKGTVYYLRNGTVGNLKNKDKLILGDVLYVKSNGFVVLNYAFDSKVKVNPNTIVKITELKKSLDQFDHSKLNTFTLELGSILVDHPNHSDELSMLVKTRRAVMGVRGTQFLAAIGLNDQSLRVAVGHGLVELKSLKKDTHVEVASGEGAMIDAVGKTQEPGTPESHKWVKAIDWNQEDTALENPEEYEKIHDNQEEIKNKKRQELLEQIKHFKPSGETVTNENLEEAIKSAHEIKQDHQVKEANQKSDSQGNTSDGLTDQEEDDLDTKVETVDFKFLKKMNKGILAKFAEKGLVPNQLKVAMEEIKGVEENNKRRIEELDKIDNEEHQ